MGEPQRTLRDRVGRLEDVLAVHETIAGYGLTIDGGLPEEGGRLWTEDCVYDSDAAAADGPFRTRAAIEGLIAGARDAVLGFGHITELPMVVVDGDRATAYAPSDLPIAREGGDYQVSRVSANQWDLERVDGRWQMERRTSRVLDGSPQGKRLFADGARRVAAERAAAALRARESSTEDEGMSNDEMAVLAQRVAELEDKFAILQLVAAYGPSIDGGAAKEAGLLWTDDCWYDSDASSAGTDGVRGRAAIEAVSAGCGEATFGIAHISHMPLIKVDGDRATVIDHSNTFHEDNGEFLIGRVSSNRWDLVRLDGVWQIERRVNRCLDGSPASKAVFAEGVREVLGS
jgi:hypothetical protein